MFTLLFEAIALGIVQGITEFFPVSSTAHLILVPWFFHWSGEVNTLMSEVALHAGTVAALCSTVFTVIGCICFLRTEKPLRLFSSQQFRPVLPA